VHRRQAHGVNDLELDQLVGQQPQRPSGPSSRRVAASQLDQVRLGPTVQRALTRGQRLLLSFQGCGHAFESAAFPDAFNRRHAYAEVVGDLDVR